MKCSILLYFIWVFSFSSTPAGVSSIQRVNSMQSRGHKTFEYEKNKRY